MTRLLLAGLLLATACASPSAGPGAPATSAVPDGCPASAVVSPAERRPLAVPAPPTTETTGRLVPQAAPQQALLCRYGPVPGDAAPAPVPLSRQHDLAGGLERVPQDLLLPRDLSAGRTPCTRALGPVTGYLLRLAYADGVVWVAGAEEVNGCVGTTDGPFTSPVDTGDVLAASLAAGAWTMPPQEDADQRCVPERAGRAGQEVALLPSRPSSLVLCRVAGDGVTRRTASPAQLAAVQDVLADPVAVPSTRTCDGDVSGQYELVARYPSGPAVQVRFLTGCRPDVDNGSLQAQLEPAGARRLQALLEGAFGS